MENVDLNARPAQQKSGALEEPAAKPVKRIKRGKLAS